MAGIWADACGEDRMLAYRVPVHDVDPGIVSFRSDHTSSLRPIWAFPTFGRRA